MSANESLMAYAISHAIGVSRYGTSVLIKVLEILKDADDDITERITKTLAQINDRGFDLQPRSTARMLELQKQLRAVIDEAYRRAYGVVTNELADLAKAESIRTVEEFDKASPVRIGVQVASPRVLAQLVKKDPFQGALLKEWFTGLGDTKYKEVTRQLRIGLTQGSSLPEMVDRIAGTRANNYRDGVLEISRRQAEAVIRTAVNHVANRVRDEIFKENEWLLSGVRWVSTLDTRTTPICRSRDGKIYPVDSGPRPPAHFRCRSIIVGITKSWQELSGVETPEGDSLDDRFREELRARGFTQEQINTELRNARASMDGTVPEDLTYNEWLKKQPASVQDEVLGPTRAKLFRQGKLNVDNFVDDNGRVYTLEELRRREREAFKDAGLLGG